MIKSYLELGQIVSTHGIKGEMRFNPWCDTPDFVKKFKTLYFDNKGENSIKVVSARSHGNVVILMLDSVDDIDKARALKNKVLYMKRSDAKLPKGTWFVQELFDCKVIDDNTGKELGIITDVSETGANDVWHITNDGKEYLVPAIDEVIVSVDTENSAVVIRPMKGIFDDIG
ncbi:MAG: 16S rRNA processing protein RimM, partial [Clostridia bacterium]|nr:16S rRNA processing protein RimM [Clostridia bacterium]